MNAFPDIHHFKKLRTDLWRTPGYGQAAVMVGSGFSLNAEPVPGERRTFPLWRHLGEEMFDKLYPGDTADNGRNQRKLQSVAGLGGITLASEFEAAFGRQALDQLVLECVPNDHFIPGELHRLLLELPWADVFTTNYDTLLERTIIDERYYQLILTAEDLPGSANPRIIKLHGSFPSQRPFILTNEDYRTYRSNYAVPQDYAHFLRVLAGIEWRIATPLLRPELWTTQLPLVLGSAESTTHTTKPRTSR